MKGHTYFSTLILFIFFSFSLIGCSGGSQADKAISGESMDNPGASVGALSFQDAYPIALQLQTPSGDFITVQDGQYVEPGKKRLAAVIHGDSSSIDKVYFTDGGLYQVEAMKQGESYQADFTINNDRLYSSVLVQVIHKSQRASKEKFVFKTFQDVANDKLMLNGIGVLISNDLLNDNLEFITSSLDKYVSEAFNYINYQDSSIVTSLSYGDNNSSTCDVEINTFEPVHNDNYPFAVIHLVFTIHSVSLTAINVCGQDLITTKNNNLKVETYVALEGQGADGKHCLAINLLGSPRVSFQNDFFMRTAIEEKIASGLKSFEHSPLVADIQSIFNTMSDHLPLSITINDSVVDILSLIDKQNMDLSKYLFIDLYGVPENTSSNVLALGAGIYLGEKTSPYTSGDQTPSGNSINLNGIMIDLCQTMVNKSFDKIKEQYNGLVTNLTYGDNDPQTPDLLINSLSIHDTSDPNTKSVQANFTIKKVDFNAISLFGFSVISTTDNDLTIDATFLMTYVNNSGGYSLVLDVQDVSSVSFRDFFLGKLAVEDLAKNTIKNLDTLSTSIDYLMALISLNIVLPEDPPGLDFPDVQDVLSPYAWDLRLPERNNLGLVISQETINLVLAQLFTNSFEWNIYEFLTPVLGKDFVGFDKSSTDSQEVIMRFSVPPVLDLRSSQIRMEVDDIILEYRLNGQPQWQASVDLDLILDVRVENNGLAFYISSVPEKCHFHVMRDNSGKLGVFDHSNLVNDIIARLPAMLGNIPGGPVFNMSFEGFKPFLVINSTDNPFSISAQGGCLYIDINALYIDLSLLNDFIVKN
jgi:hypothetical protein